MKNSLDALIVIHYVYKMRGHSSDVEVCIINLFTKQNIFSEGLSILLNKSSFTSLDAKIDDKIF